MDLLRAQGYAKENQVYSTASKGGSPGLLTDAPALSGITYHFSIYRPRCETYAIRLDGSELNGIYGPLEYDEVLFSALACFPYEDQCDRIAWARKNFSDFAPCDVEYEEGM